MSRTSPPIPGLRAVIGAIALWVAVTALMALNRPIPVGVVDGEPPVPRRVLDPNHATVGELAMLPGVGPVLAARIVADRQARGPFDSLEALDRVHGIGPLRLEDMRRHLVIGADAPRRPSP